MKIGQNGRKSISASEIGGNGITQPSITGPEVTRIPRVSRHNPMLPLDLELCVKFVFSVLGSGDHVSGKRALVSDGSIVVGQKEIA
jgi:hypothetical protein